MNFRIGHGFDVHRLVPGRKLWLGGIEVPFIMGLAGHSELVQAKRAGSNVIRR